MDFENILIETQSFTSKDVISSSFNEPTVKPTVSEADKNDPYAVDKW